MCYGQRKGNLFKLYDYADTRKGIEAKVLSFHLKLFVFVLLKEKTPKSKEE